MSKLRQLILLVEADDGKVYEARLTDKQESAIRSVLVALPEPLKLVSDPLDGLEIKRPEEIQDETQPGTIKES